MLAGAFEALIGAIALDSGLEAARDFVLRFVDRDLAEVLARKEHANPKGSCKNSCKSASGSGQPIALFISKVPIMPGSSPLKRGSLTIHLVRVTAPASGTRSKPQPGMPFQGSWMAKVTRWPISPVS